MIRSLYKSIMNSFYSNNLTWQLWPQYYDVVKFKKKKGHVHDRMEHIPAEVYISK